VAGQVRFVSLADGRVTAELPRSGHVGEVDDLALAPDGELLATCGADNSIGFWRAADGAYSGLLDGFEERIVQLAFADRRDRLITLQQNGTVTLWTLTIKQEAGQPPLVSDAQPSWMWTRSAPAEARAGRQILPLSKGSLIAVADESDVVLLDAVSGKPASRIELKVAGSSGAALDLAESPQENLLAVLCSDGWIVQWDLKGQRPQNRWFTRRLDFQRIAYCRETPLLAAAGSSVTLWDSIRGELFCDFAEGARAASLAASHGVLVVEQEDQGLQQIPLHDLLQALADLGFARPSPQGAATTQSHPK
jgi:WD40 repeat protein